MVRRHPIYDEDSETIASLRVTPSWAMRSHL